MRRRLPGSCIQNCCVHTPLCRSLNNTVPSCVFSESSFIWTTSRSWETSTSNSSSFLLQRTETADAHRRAKAHAQLLSAGIHPGVPPAARVQHTTPNTMFYRVSSTARLFKNTDTRMALEGLRVMVWHSKRLDLYQSSLLPSVGAPVRMSNIYCGSLKLAGSHKTFLAI